jgi:cytochrome P450
MGFVFEVRMSAEQDPFKQQREQSGVQFMRAEGRDFPLFLRHADVKDACRDWQTFSSDDPFMIVPHSEAHVRTARQLPIEIDPPDHKEYRTLVEGLFKRPNDPAYRQQMQALADRVVAECLSRGTFDAVRELALPLQSRSLALLLGVDESEAELWISWGVHVFKEGDGVSKGKALTDYVARKFAEAQGSAGDDFFSLLSLAEFRGRKLTDEEKQGFAGVTFAGGRDTIIHTVSGTMAHCATHPDALGFLRADPARITLAIEEVVRHVSPLTAIARKCPAGADIAGVHLNPGDRLGLCWPSANRDEKVFSRPDEMILDRSPNPHLGFGFGVHHCLGAPQARLILRCLITALCEKVGTIRLVEAKPQIEMESSFERQVGYERLRVTATPRAGG